MLSLIVLAITHNSDTHGDQTFIMNVNYLRILDFLGIRIWNQVTKSSPEPAYNPRIKQVAKLATQVLIPVFTLESKNKLLRLSSY
jgi:hypothetical protein